MVKESQWVVADRSRFFLSSPFAPTRSVRACNFVYRTLSLKDHSERPRPGNGGRRGQQLGPKPNPVVRLQVMFDSSYVFRPTRPKRPKGRAQKAIGKKALALFGNSNLAPCSSLGGDPYRRMPLVMEVDTFRPVLIGPAFMGKWIMNEWMKMQNNKSQ